MKCRRLSHLGLCLVFIFSGIRNFAQGQTNNPSPRKIDTYGDLIEDDAQGHLDYFLNELQKEPNSKGYIIAYTKPEYPPGTARRYALRSKAYLVVRGLDPNRVVALDGGRREEITMELWIVPTGASAPVPKPTATPEPEDHHDNLLYDEYAAWDEDWSGLESGSERLDGFAEALKREPRSWACIVAYAQNGDDRMGMEWDRPGTALKTARGTKNYLVKKLGIAPSRITVVDGGYSEGRMVALWIMRPNAKFDSGPFLFSYRVRVGKGGQLRVIPRKDISKVCCDVCRRKQLFRH